MLPSELVENNSSLPSEIVCFVPENIAVQSQVLSILRQSNYRQIQQLTCFVREHCIVLCGVVDSFYLKQLAQALLRRFSLEGWAIHNTIDVRW